MLGTRSGPRRPSSSVLDKKSSPVVPPVTKASEPGVKRKAARGVPAQEELVQTGRKRSRVDVPEVSTVGEVSTDKSMDEDVESPADPTASKGGPEPSAATEPLAHQGVSSRPQTCE